ncbi:MAG TPA: translation initiation factor IF-3 [Candidatus Scybalousia intestinigallinarum]|nr:translation initiation factor IF-3 [Candidatus Scybalousia intestinigallinarum]
MPINEQIKASNVLVIGPNGEQVGVKPLKDALTLASYAGLDLVLMNANSNPPVCKVMDYNKYRYEKQKKEKEASKRQKANSAQLKEFRLSPVIDVGDFETKLRNVRKYLEKGDKIKLSIRFKGRQLAHTELGKEVLQKFAAKLEDVSIIDQPAKLDGRSMTMLLAPKKEK